MKEYTEKDLERVYDAIENAIKDEPIILVMPAVLSVVELMISKATTENITRMIACDFYTSITEATNDRLKELSTKERTH